MQRILFAAILGLLVGAQATLAQQKLKTDGYGSFSGKVTLVGKIPEVVDLTEKMKGHADKACCLDKNAKPFEKVEMTWMVDPKTKAVKNVMVFVMPPDGNFFEIPFKLRKRKDIAVIDQPHCAFLERVTVYNPVYFDEKTNGYLPTGQKLLIKNSSTVPHNSNVVGNQKDNIGFNRNLPPKTDLDADDLSEKEKLNPQLLPLSISCGSHTWMAAKLFVFDHPYYAMTKEDGTFEIPQVPAGAAIRLYAYHEGVGWLNEGYKKGQPLTIKKGEKNTVNFELKAP